MVQFLADALLVAHFLFIAFVLGGGLLLLRWPRLAWIHLPAAAWGAVVEIMAWTCPLTPLENHQQQLGGGMTYHQDFIAHYLLPVVYPDALTPALQAILGGGVIALNCIIYTAVIWVRKHAGEHEAK